MILDDHPDSAAADWLHIGDFGNRLDRLTPSNQSAEVGNFFRNRRFFSPLKDFRPATIIAIGVAKATTSRLDIALMNFL